MIVKKSKKKHVCDSCGKDIPKGSRYARLEHNGGHSEGGYETKEHLNCEEFTDKFTVRLANNP